MQGPQAPELPVDGLQSRKQLSTSERERTQACLWCNAGLTGDRLVSASGGTFLVPSHYPTAQWGMLLLSSPA